MRFHSPNHKILFSRQRSFSISIYSTKFSLSFFIIFITLLLLLQFKIIKTPILNSSSCTHLAGDDGNQTKASALRFLPLKDLRFAATPMDGNTWFMSSINDTRDDGDAEHLYFPSESSDGRLLCLSGRNVSNGTANLYAFASPVALPADVELVRGLTFVSDTYYDYDNLWHGLAALVPFVSWHERKGCVLAERWVLYHRGELRTSMSPWVRQLVEAAFGREVVIDNFEGSTVPRCFEKAVVIRHNEGSMSKSRKEEVYDMLRCKARAHCQIKREAEDMKLIRLTLFLRVGTRSFEDDEAVIQIFGKECRKVQGCQLKVSRPNNLTFCDQVKLLSETDVLVSSHGAQMTNMVFMDRNSSVMEFFPKGWHEMAGVGQYVFRWMADSAAVKHKGQWHDPKGQKCPESDESRCFPFYKDKQIKHYEAYFSNWAASVLKEMREQKLVQISMNIKQAKLRSSSCKCNHS